MNETNYVIKFQFSYSIPNDKPSDSRTNDPRNGSNSIGNAHEYSRILRRDVQVIDGESSPGESPASQRERDARDGRAPHHHQGGQGHEDGLAGVRAAGEDLANLQKVMEKGVWKLYQSNWSLCDMIS